ncbi:MAG: hypothetical protein R3199_04375 [Gemmatimonadota bacterium]|nr:hypothetical protein [Gemmatimonadota bacterium]
MSTRTEWIDRYVAEVARRLPRRQREDVARELASLIEDEIDARLEETAGRDPESVTLDYLAELGPPAQVARRYRSERPPLVGPRLYPAFRISVAVVLGVYAALAALWIAGIHTTIEMVPFWFRFAADTSWYEVFVGATANFGTLVVAFALLDRLDRRGDRADTTGSWDPTSLPEPPDPERISRVRRIVPVAILLLLLLVFHTAPGWLRYVAVVDGEWIVAPLLHPNYRTFLPWLDAWWLSALALHAGILVQGRKPAWARWADIAVDVFGAWVLWRIVSDGPFTTLDPAFKPLIGIVLFGLLVAVVIQTVENVRDAGRRHEPTRLSRA